MAAKLKILLVEDEPDFRHVLRLRLEANGYEVLEAEDGAQGLDLARNQSPALIILDIMLPKMDGFKVARLLKFDEKYRRIPVLMLTARIQPQDQETGKTVGCDAYLTKPVKPEALLETITRLLAASHPGA